jgi:hypothetical protein
VPGLRQALGESLENAEHEDNEPKWTRAERRNGPTLILEHRP